MREWPRAAVAAALICCGGLAMSMPALPEASDLAGRWTIAEGARTCRLTLTTRPAGRDHAVEADRACLEQLGLGAVVAWRPASDGIGLAAAGGRTIAFLSRRPNGEHALSRPGRADLVLRRG